MARGDTPALVLLGALAVSLGYGVKEIYFPAPRHAQFDPEYRKDFTGPGVVMPYNALEAQKKWKPETVPGYKASLDDSSVNADPCHWPAGARVRLGTEDLENKLRNTNAIACNGWKALTGHTTPGQKEAAAEQGAATLGFEHPKMLGKVLQGTGEQPTVRSNPNAPPF